jgi:hypothetical protein
MENVFSFSASLFALTVALSIYLFYKAAHHSKTALFVLLGWALLQSAVGLGGFYTKTAGLPPRIMLTVVPTIIAMIFLFVTGKGRVFIDGLDKGMLTLLSVVRIPVEIVLFLLFTSGSVPKLMTFEGANFDVLSGISAVLVYFLVFRKKVWGNKALLIWNFICLALLINIVVIAVLSVPSDLQRLSFEQPNIAVLYFPFVLLPAVVVPLVLFSHLASIRQLLKKN